MSASVHPRRLTVAIAARRQAARCISTGEANATFAVAAGSVLTAANRSPPPSASTRRTVRRSAPSSEFRSRFASQSATVDFGGSIAIRRPSRSSMIASANCSSGSEFEDLSEDCGRRRLGSSREGCIEAVRKHRRAQADFARGGFQREIPFEPQVLKRHGDRAYDRENEAYRRGRGKPASARERARPRQKLRSRVESGGAASPTDLCVRAIVRACRACTRHCPGQTSSQINLREPAVPAESVR